MASSGYLPGSEFAFHDLYHFRLWSNSRFGTPVFQGVPCHPWRFCRPVSCWAPAARYGGNYWRRLASAWRSVCRALMRKVWATEAMRKNWFISWPKRKQMYLQEEFKELFFKYPFLETDISHQGVGKGNSSWKVPNGKGYVSFLEVHVSADDLSGLNCF